MEVEMKQAEEEIRRRKEREERLAEKERNKSVIATPGRFDASKTPKRTPHRFGI